MENKAQFSGNQESDYLLNICFPSHGHRMKVITASKRHCLWVMNARNLLVHQGVIYSFQITSSHDTCMHSSVSTCMHELISNRCAVTTCVHFQDMFIISDEEGQYQVLIKYPVLYECNK